MKEESVIITCPKCDTAFTARYSPYSPEKTVKCTNCGAEIPLPEKHSEPLRINKVSTPATGTPKVEDPISSWLISNRYVLSGYISLAVTILFMAISLASVQVYLPLCIVTIVFGILAVVDKKPIQGLVLILFATVIVSAFHGYLFDQRHGAEVKEMEQSMKKLQEMIKK
ncbi:MAG: hypothetical protein PHR77_17370 [Kiritimatiellae bacterium]|nr:hypothetical protein [Kiritimatiellia bacterium]MDD5520315.1 hypothetical protein [Kiritimatiellia bacterium]